METLWQDLRYGFRMLWKSPGFTAVAVLSLALGIGANTSIFSLINTVLLRPLLVERPDQLVSVYSKRNTAMGLAVFSYPDYVDYRDRNEVFTGLLAYRFVPLSLSHGGKNERVWGYLVSGNYFAVLGVKAALGRTLLPEEDRAPGAHPVAVVSYGGWKRRFGSDPGLVGKTITLNGHRFTVVGIAPKGFSGTELAFVPDLWVPMMMQAQIEPGSDWLHKRREGRIFLLGRLKPGITVAQAQASLNTLASQLGKEYPQTNEGQRITLSPPGLFVPEFREEVIGFAGVLMVVVGLVLALACNNLANLLLARAAQRRKEIAIRLALGASRARLVRQLLTESVLLSIAGGGVGLLLALWINDLVAAFKPPIDFSLAIDLKMDHRVLLFTSLLSLMTGVVFGLVPAWQATKPDLVPALKDEASVRGYRRSRLRDGLVIVQMALSMVLLIGAGLVVRSLQRAQTIRPGFDPENAIQMWFDVGLQGYDKTRGQEFQHQLQERVAVLPGVRSASLANYVPLSFGWSEMSVYLEGQPPQPAANVPTALYSTVGLSYFQTMSTPLVEGRDFTPHDREGAPKVVIINETCARRFWPGQSPVGKRIRSSSQGPFLQIIGVVKDGKYISLGESPRPMLYLPLLQNYDSSVALLVRTTSDPKAMIAAIRREVQRLDESLPVFDVKTLTEHMSLSLFPARIAATLLGSFGVLALMLAAVGIYGVMAYAVTQRTREVGIRRALGAQDRDVLRLVVGQGMILTLIGASVGLAGAFGATRLLVSLLYEVSPVDPATFAATALLLTAVALLACYIPGRRATKVDPMVALRYE